MKAARDRLQLKQKEVAARMNVSLHTFRRWDQGRNQPKRLEQVQLLARILQTPIDVLWPVEQDPQVAEALRQCDDERPNDGPAPGGASGRVELRRAEVVESSRNGTSGVVGVELPSGVPAARSRAPRRSGESGGDQVVEVVTPSVRDVSIDVGAVDRAATSEERDLPPWPADVPNGETSAGVAVSEAPAGGSSTRSVLSASAEAERLTDAGPVTLPSSRLSLRQRRIARVAAVLGVALLLGGVTVLVVSGVGDGDAGVRTAAPNSRIASAPEQTAAEARGAGEMRAAVERRDYDAAIDVARRFGDASAVGRLQREAATVLVHRAAAATSRGELPLARKRLRLATEKYGTAPGAAAIRARIRDVERARAKRAERRRVAARRQAAQAAPASEAASAAGAVTSESAGGGAAGSGGTAQGGGSGSAAGSASPEPSAGPTSSSGGTSGAHVESCDSGCGLGPFP